eukprot:TRINITY_DN84846_c0_g1_i1.p1 TRINITY_DN84846_c0_g1~~TRINITY_DN84846_c0_g1_i1.p1  ORF type:complete len:413 (+),score=123.47 TRINITY_DN84846_c0_g1_i1:31-1269(+)
MAAAGYPEGAACRNCGSQVAKPLRCSICKSAAYCSGTCQKEDWQFHKRICKKAEPVQETRKKPEDEAAQKEEMKRAMAELGKDSDPKMAAQVQQMMAGMMGMEVPEECKVEEKKPLPECQSCSKPCEKPLRCGTCKSVTYCCAQCQKDDWRFHKRICKKPAAPAVEAPAAPEAKATNAEPSEEPKSKRPTKENESVVVKHEDVGTWYSHRDWKPEEPRKEFQPSKVENVVDTSQAAGSAWNAAGTWEEKNMIPWWKEHLQGLVSLGDGEVMQVDKVDSIAGDASIVHVRGQPKFLSDVSCELHFSGLQRCKACARSPPGSRCSNCMRIKGLVKVSEVACDTGATPSFQVQAAVPDGPSHVKKAGQKECCSVAEEHLLPLVKTKLAEIVAEYKGLVPDAPKWASQLPPKVSTT